MKNKPLGKRYSSMLSAFSHGFPIKLTLQLLPIHKHRLTKGLCDTTGTCWQMAYFSNILVVCTKTACVWAPQELVFPIQAVFTSYENWLCCKQLLNKPLLWNVNIMTEVRNSSIQLILQTDNTDTRAAMYDYHKLLKCIYNFNLFFIKSLKFHECQSCQFRLLNILL